MSQTKSARKLSRLADGYRLSEAALKKFHTSGPPALREPKAAIFAAINSPGSKSSKLANELGPAELHARLAHESPISKLEVQPPKQPTFSPEVADKPVDPKPAGEIKPSDPFAYKKKLKADAVVDPKSAGKIKPWDPSAYKKKPKADAAVVAVDKAGDGGDGGPEHESGDHARDTNSATDKTVREAKLDGDWEVVASVDDEEDWEIL